MEGEGRVLRMDLVRRRVELDRRRNALKKELEEVEAEIRSLHEPILSDMTQANLRNIPLDDGPTVIYDRQIFCNRRSGIDNDALAEAAKKAGLEWLLRVDFKTRELKGWIKEQEEEHGMQPGGPADLLPPELRPFFSLCEEHRTKVMGAGVGNNERGDHERRDDGSDAF